MASIAASEESDNVENDGANGSGGDNSESFAEGSCAESVGVATIVEEIPPENMKKNFLGENLMAKAEMEPEFRGYLLEPEPYDDSDEDEITKKHANYFDWKTYFPQVAELVENVEVIRTEMRALTDWRPWPEQNLYSARKEWNVFPFLHTFPATDESKMTWVPHFCDQCPKTSALLKKIKGIRTALFSRMGPGTVLAAHRGWADLSNHVLRLHLALEVPEEKSCGLWVRGEKQFHSEGEVICFDDSKLHKAFNLSDQQRKYSLVLAHIFSLNL